MAAETMVGVPFFEQETQMGLDIALSNIGECLGNIGVAASVVVMLNGPETAKGHQVPLQVPPETHGTPVTLMRTPHRGQVAAINELVAVADVEGLSKLFITDADIYRFPDSMANMWRQANAPVVGAQYRAYPLEVVEEAGYILPDTEKILYQIFEANKTPGISHLLDQRGHVRPKRLKGSLMLVDVAFAADMHGQQDLASDSVINRRLAEGDLRIAEDAYFMHWGRTDLTDHIRARLRHYRGAAAQGDLAGFRQKQPALPDAVIDTVAQDIRASLSGGQEKAQLFLLRWALRAAVDVACRDIVQNAWAPPAPWDTPPNLNTLAVATYAEAQEIIQHLMSSVDWAAVQGYGLSAPPTTQTNLPRHALDLSNMMSRAELAVLARKYWP